MSNQSHLTQSDLDELGLLIAKASTGDEHAWVELVSLYSRRVFAMAKSRLHDDELAEEITQSVFVTIATKLTSTPDDGHSAVSGYTERGKFEPWLFRITMNRVRDLCRKRSRHAKPTDPEQFSHIRGDQEPGFHEREEQDQQLSALRQVMEQLPEADRELIELRHHGQMSFKQIAECTGDPIGTLLARHHRALKKLRSLMESMNKIDTQNDSKITDRHINRPDEGGTDHDA